MLRAYVMFADRERIEVLETMEDIRTRMVQAMSEVGGDPSRAFVKLHTEGGAANEHFIRADTIIAFGEIR